MNHHLANMTWPEIGQALAEGATTLILPLGATEQHGPHLPISTDTLRAEALAARLATHLPNTLIAPPLPIGCSDEHAGFPGLLSLNTATMTSLIVECAQRLAAWGIERLIILSAHGGNKQAICDAVARLQYEVPKLQIQRTDALETPIDSDDEGRSKPLPPEIVGIHAGEGETSQILHLRPDLVDLDRAEPGYVGDMIAIIPQLKAEGLRAVTANGILGDPRPAEAQRGEQYLDAWAEAVANRLRAEFAE